jgi:hypothetical protein
MYRNLFSSLRFVVVGEEEWFAIRTSFVEIGYDFWFQLCCILKLFQRFDIYCTFRLKCIVRKFYKPSQNPERISYTSEIRYEQLKRRSSCSHLTRLPLIRCSFIVYVEMEIEPTPEMMYTSVFQAVGNLQKLSYKK